MVLLLTALACVTGCEAIRQVPWLRPAFGMKLVQPPTRVAASPAE